jgi:hypothetical protein
MLESRRIEPTFVQKRVGSVVAMTPATPNAYFGPLALILILTHTLMPYYNI